MKSVSVVEAVPQKVPPSLDRTSAVPSASLTSDSWVEPAWQSVPAAPSASLASGGPASGIEAASPTVPESATGGVPPEEVFPLVLPLLEVVLPLLEVVLPLLEVVLPLLLDPFPDDDEALP